MRIRKETMSLPVDGGLLSGILQLNLHARSVIMIGEPSGTAAQSQSSILIANEINKAGFTALAINLLTEREEFMERTTRHLRFDKNLIAYRLLTAIEWLRQDSQTKDLQLGLLVERSACAAAVKLASSLIKDQPLAGLGDIGAIVLIDGGMPDLDEERLAYLRAPTLCVVGKRNPGLINANKRAVDTMNCPHKLSIIDSSAIALLDDAGACEIIAKMASAWFQEHLALPHAFAVPNSMSVNYSI